LIIETTVRKAAWLRLATHLVDGLNVEQLHRKHEIQQRIEANAEDAFEKCGVQLVPGGGFAFMGTDLMPSDEIEKLYAYPVKINLEARQLAFLSGLVKQATWPRLTTPMEHEIGDLDIDVAQWAVDAQNEETFKKLPKDVRKRLREEDENEDGDDSKD